ncbi:hypothetical protein FHX73_11562 [Kitasatospora viridis]|uniref:Uncharacterized protein n=2 Tax=Kitasatospora viridis TaxID=281105 RepID=A0A561UBS3_9ACTN|nr:hypothetical protein FHX73_11562 [Kitasatospora viridis]
MVNEEAPRLQTHEIRESGPGWIALVVRVHATVRVGATFRCVDEDGREVILELREIQKYRGVTLRQLEPPNAALMVFCGPGAERLAFGRLAELIGVNPPTAG